MKFEVVQPLCQRAPGWTKPGGHGVLDSFALGLLVVPVSEATVVLPGPSAGTACHEQLSHLKHHRTTGRNQQLRPDKLLRYPR